jgi:methyl-accepting chemotaxis protein
MSLKVLVRHNKNSKSQLKYQKSGGEIMKTIKAKLILCLSTIAFAICLLLGIINAFLIYNTAYSGMDTSVSSSADAYARAIENSINIYKTKIESMATDTRITPASTDEEIKKICVDLQEKYGFLNVSFANAKGVPYDNDAIDLTGRDYFKSAITGTSFISSPLVSKRVEANSAIVLYIAAKVNNGTGYDGIVFAELANDVFSQMIKDVTIGEKGSGFVVDKTGTIVADRDVSLVESFTNYITLSETDSSYKNMAEFISEMLTKKTGKKIVNFGGNDKYIVYTPISGAEGWILAMAADESEMMDSFKKGITISIIVAIVFVGISILISLLFARSIGNPINKIAAAADRLAIGDIGSDVDVNVKSKDEIGLLAKSFKSLIASMHEQAQAIERLADADLTVEITPRSERDLVGKKLVQLANQMNDIMTDISSASEQVAGGARHISDSSMALSQGATEQASSIEELTASIEQISTQTKLNTQNANQANELADTAKSDAIQGNDQMKDMLKAMDEINESSANISKIIKVIDDIAFQTNILALNAAVEAARAGQHGKGFAVVAEEVRNLAARSANAAKETTEMIEGSIRKAEGGTTIAKNTAEALNKIVNEIEKVAKLVNDISVASNEQYSAISQISQGIMQVSQVVQSNSATSEESAAASEELSSQAELLNELVVKFKLKKSDKTNGKLEKLSPEVLKMFEEMSHKGKAISGESEDNSARKAAVNTNIALSDKEFGKY